VTFGPTAAGHDGTKAPTAEDLRLPARPRRPATRRGARAPGRSAPRRSAQRRDHLIYGPCTVGVDRPEGWRGSVRCVG